MDTEKNIVVKIPAPIQEKIDREEYKLRGTQLRDRNGRIVGNLEALEAPENKYFSPQIFVSFEQYSFVSVTAVSIELRNYVEAKMRDLSAMDSKLNTIIERQTASLFTSVDTFSEHFRSLREGNVLISPQATFSLGIEAACELTLNLGSYFNGYVNSTEVWYGLANQPTTYGDYLRGLDPLLNLPVKKSRFKPFSDSPACALSYAFLEVLNGINLLSIVFNGKVHSPCGKSLDVLEAYLRDTLEKLIDGIGDEGDIYGMMYANDEKDQYCKVDVLRIQDILGVEIIQGLISRVFGHLSRDERDFARLKSIYAVVDLLEEIRNLRMRTTSLEFIQLPGSPEVAALKSALFGESNT